MKVWRNARAATAIALLAALIVTALIYAPGLDGQFVQDDYPNIVDNPYLRVHGSDLASWMQAAWSSPSSDLRRPLASLSFAADYAVDGLAPGPMKAVNVAIHLLNGALLFVLLMRIARAADRENLGDDTRRTALALLVTVAWLLHPINLTAVLYVVQRMESLAQVFVLLGLIAYVEARRRFRDGGPGAHWRLWIAVPACTVLGLLAKESAVLLPAYAFMLEITVFARDIRTRVLRRELAAFFSLFLFVPGIIAVTWLMHRYLPASAWSARPFTLTERLLTEPRIIVEYGAEILVPVPSWFSLYHDDYPLSTGLLTPWTTLPAILILIAAALAGVALRRRHPLIAFGIFGFLVAHALTATFIPLELVYEHRNYFASALLLLAAGDALLPARRAGSRLVAVRLAICAAVIALAGFSLALRAREWSDPLLLAKTEVARHPESARATYELGRTYALLSRYDANSPLLDEAYSALERAAAVPDATILPEIALITVASRAGRPIEPRWWESMRAKLARKAPSIENLSALAQFLKCQRNGDCPQNNAAMLHILLAAIGHEHPHPSALYSYALFAHDRLKDPELALRLARAAADAPPQDPQYRLNLAAFLVELGRDDEARRELAKLRGQVRWGQLSTRMSTLERRLDDAPRDDAAAAQAR